MNPDVKELLTKIEALRLEYYPILRNEPHGSIGDAVLTVLDTIYAANETNTLQELPLFCAAFAIANLKPSDFGLDIPDQWKTKSPNSLGGTNLPKK